MGKSPFVISATDEGLQLNAGTRLGFIGSGYGLDGFDKALKALKKTAKKANFELGPIYTLSSQEDDWQDKALKSRNITLVSSKMTKWSKQHDLEYAGHLDFGDPREYVAPSEFSDGVKGHLVRPPKIHVATGIALTCGGGEQTFDLRNYVISADWLVGCSDLKLAGELLNEEICYCRKTSGRDLKISFELDGPFGAEIAAENKALAEQLLVPTE